MAERGSGSGRLRPRSFWLAVVALYAAALAAQMLTAPAAVARVGVWPFAAAQGVLIWLWYWLHARRLRDAGRSPAPALGLAIVNALAILLLVLAVAFFFGTAVELPDAAAQAGHVPVTSILGLYVFFYLVGMVWGPPSAGLLGVMLAILVLAACAPALIALGFTVWAGTRPSVAAAPPPQAGAA
jgi:uncharacterized membrane protein YhaH (DUF805 family)